MRKFLALALAWALCLAVPAYAESVTGPTPTTVGTSLPGQVAATATNDDAAAGKVGEYIESVVLFASPTSIPTSGVEANVTSISLTAGDWDVWGNVVTVPAGATTTTQTVSGISTTSATLPDVSARWFNTISFAAGTNASAPPPSRRLSLSGTTTVYLVGRANFSVSTMGMCGFIAARRVR